MGRLDARIAVVTGGASGIGRATVERFVAEGATVESWDIADSPDEALPAEVVYRQI
ncbi:MAG: SDR family NAD(P)-dependent oxidoreductase, partial [Acidimicrobiia bacterium]|nr:SDR family NAD(P)-dependent oxidoreductase [Acidimicrobiia bacterium]